MNDRSKEQEKKPVFHERNPNAAPRELGDEGLPVFNAREMVGDGVQALITLDGQTYVLRITRQGKLILTK